MADSEGTLPAALAFCNMNACEVQRKRADDVRFSIFVTSNQ